MRSLVITALVAVGCAAESQRQQAVPQPSTFQLNGTMAVDLPPELTAQGGLPPVLKGTLQANARSEAISASPLRSRHEGHMSFVIIDGTGKPIVNINIDVDGESDGPPSTGLELAMKRFLDAAALTSRPVERIEK